jgi:hypothetical protein
VTFRYRSATYHLAVENPGRVERGVQGIWVDGQAVARDAVELVDDGRKHEVKVVLGSASNEKPS